MPAKKIKLLRGVLTEVSSQRTQYKPYGYKLSFDELYSGVAPVVYVEVEVPAEYIVDEGGEGEVEYVVLSLDGLNAVLKTTADSVDKLQEEYFNRFQD